MIQIESITIIEFRGIRNLELEFNKNNFAICGPNGTGKSGIVDALEFALTGNVSRLSGEGRGEISLKQHGPHVDKRNDPEKSRVIIKVNIPHLNKGASVERSVLNPKKCIITPNNPDILEVLQHVEEHPEIVLSRRELIRYVLATPGKRAEEVQALLHLEQVEQVRSGLQKIANSSEKTQKTLESKVKEDANNLLRALGISELAKEKVLIATNEKRAILGLSPLMDLNESISLKDGMASTIKTNPQIIPKLQAIADIQATKDAFEVLNSASTISNMAQAVENLTKLINEKSLEDFVKKEKFYSMGMDLIYMEACPFCDTAWKLAELKQHVADKIEKLNEISKKRKETELKLVPLIDSIQKIRASINTINKYVKLSTPSLDFTSVNKYNENCERIIYKLNAFIPISETITAIRTLNVMPGEVLVKIDELNTYIASLPEPSKGDAARDWLTVAQERLEIWRESKRKFNVEKMQAQKTRLISDIYAATSDKVLTGIYNDVEKDFESLYKSLNHDDEDKFKAKLIPSIGKLGFDVDFYGRGFFPPGAYHSEGHQDSMGLCLYLALMRYLQGPGFTFAVLDDVLMSIDSSHRREACALLKKEFPNTQFIMTTHDPIWLRHMITEGLVKSRSAVQFRNWNVDQGPIKWDDKDVWLEIDDYLKNNDVRAAAALLRHYLEYTSAELCHRLRVPVEFRGDGQYQLGELLPEAITKMYKLFSKAKESANSWSQKEMLEQISAFESQFKQLVLSSNAEQWQINVAVHYNNWDNLVKSDFEPVVKAFRSLINGFVCSNCGQYLRISPERETPQSIRCDCGKTNINLLIKPKS